MKYYYVVTVNEEQFNLFLSRLPRGTTKWPLIKLGNSDGSNLTHHCLIFADSKIVSEATLGLDELVAVETEPTMVH
jgi:hypothetical protein